MSQDTTRQPFSEIAGSVDDEQMARPVGSDGLAMMIDYAVDVVSADRAHVRTWVEAQRPIDFHLVVRSDQVEVLAGGGAETRFVSHREPRGGDLSHELDVALGRARAMRSEPA